MRSKPRFFSCDWCQCVIQQIFGILRNKLRPTGVFRIVFTTLLCVISSTWQLNAQTPERKDDLESVLSSQACRDVSHAKSRVGGNLQDDTETQLAEEWLDPDAATNLLSALRLLTSGSEAPDLQERVLEQLASNRFAKLRGLYVAAMGVPDVYGQPTAETLPSFLDTLAKASTVNAQEPVQKANLCECSNKLVELIYGYHNPSSPHSRATSNSRTGQQKQSGFIVVARVNSYFAAGENYLALYELLAGFPDPNHGDLATARKNYVLALEILRAEFATNADSLADQVAHKITPDKQ